MKLEVIGFNIESCTIAQNAGAFRIELCDNEAEGGTTPSLGFIKAARAILSIKLYPIIRPRGGDFLYSNAEFEMMKTDIECCKNEDCDGIVIGILNRDGSVDKQRCQQLVELAYPMGVTFHRAFDRTNDSAKALEDIVEIGCERILTSGQAPTALAGTSLIKVLIQQANDRIVIMPGSGIRSNNIKEIAETTGAKEFHTSAKMYTNSKMNFMNPAMAENLQHLITNEDEIIKMIENF